MGNISQAQETYNITATGSFSPASVAQGDSSTLVINVCNLTPTGDAILSGRYYVQVSLGAGVSSDEMELPTGNGAGLFSWSLNGNTWFGIATSDIALGCVQINIPVDGDQVSANNSTYLAGIVAPHTDSPTGPNENQGTATLTVTEPVLPVTYTHFNVDKATCDQVDLEWGTAQETNNEGFFVERSLDAQHFINMGFVQGQGNSDTRKDYEYSDVLDVDVVNKTLYYRLMQVDYDGEKEYSDIISVRQDCSEQVEITVEGYPNPVSNKYNVLIKGMDDMANLLLLDSNKKLVKQQMIEPNIVTSISMSSYHSGIYFITVTDKNNKVIETKKVIKI